MRTERSAASAFFRGICVPQAAAHRSVQPWRTRAYVHMQEIQHLAPALIR